MYIKENINTPKADAFTSYCDVIDRPFAVGVKFFIMLELNKIKESMTSIEIAEVIEKRHADVLRDMRKMSDAWLKVTKKHFKLDNYIDKTGRSQPFYILNKPEYIFVLSYYNDAILIKICNNKSISEINDLIIKKNVYNKKEQYFYENYLLNVFNSSEIKRQFKVGKYRIDFYIPKYNLAIEYDEKHHLSLKNKKKDILREKEIKKIINCEFIRINEDLYK